MTEQNILMEDRKAWEFSRVFKATYLSNWPYLIKNYYLDLFYFNK